MSCDCLLTKKPSFSFLKSVDLLSVVQDVVVVDVHQDGERLADDDRDPHRCVTVVTAQEAPHEPG